MSAAPAPAAGPAYYAEGMAIWKSPIQNDKPDGSTTITIGFHALNALPIIGENGARTVAAMLCAAEQHERLHAALQIARDALEAACDPAKLRTAVMMEGAHLSQQQACDIIEEDRLGLRDALARAEAALALSRGGRDHG